MGQGGSASTQALRRKIISSLPGKRNAEKSRGWRRRLAAEGERIARSREAGTDAVTLLVHHASVPP